jgi:2-polyprenyl-3-methyl-5-hydroxy-6-metoxy-1,4-benzoquinol methylase
MDLSSGTRRRDTIWELQLIACLPPAGDVLTKQRRAGRGQGSVLVIGLGGGALPIYLHDVFSFDVYCVDLDEVVIRLAKTHFGFVESKQTPKLEVHMSSLRSCCAVGIHHWA